MSTKKYKLFSGKDGKAPCAFFLSDKGCRNGDNCKFSHEKPESSSEQNTNVISEVGSVVSSESGGEQENPFVIPKADDGPSAGTKRKNRRSVNSDPFAKKSKGNAKSTQSPNPKQQQQQESAKKASAVEAPNSAKSDFRSLNLPVADFSLHSASSPQPSKPSKSDGVDFRSLNLPIADFNLPSAGSHAKVQDSHAKVEDSHAKAEEENDRNTLENPPLPKSHDAAKKWIHAVEMTQKHKRFNVDFSYEKTKEASENKGWFKTKRYGDWCKNNPQIIAIDCEMCETEDPATKKKNPSALCRISVVDAVTDEVLLNSLVKPSFPVTDYRTFVNGINAESLANVQFTLEHAQSFMQALCSDETVIVGHAVHHDLKSLFMEHYCCADSALLFHARDNDQATVSLKDCVHSITGKEMPKVHDSVNDARAALRCVEHFVEKKGKVKSIVRRQFEMRKEAATQLFVHRLPKVVTTKHLESMILDSTKVAVTKVDEITPVGDGSMGKTLLHFLSAAHANLAFETLSGKAELDTGNKLQKRIYLRGGQYIKIRKNVAERPRRAPETPNKN